MLPALTQLLIYQLIGEVITRWFALPVPGPVIGMLLLFLTLAIRNGPSGELQSISQGLLQHLSLLFIPAGTGVMVHFHRIEAEWLPIVLSLVVSTILTLAVTALLLRALSHRSSVDHKWNQ